MRFRKSSTPLECTLSMITKNFGSPITASSSFYFSIRHQPLFPSITRSVGRLKLIADPSCGFPPHRTKRRRRGI